MDQSATTYEPPCGVHEWNPTVRYGLLGCICRDPLDLLGDQLERGIRAFTTALKTPACNGFRSGLPEVSYRGLDLRTIRREVQVEVER